jgi:hypothetical protein
MKEKGDYKICSLSTDWKPILQWAHYADGFKGLAIEIEMREENLNEVEYKDRIPTVNNSKVGTNPAKTILSFKHSSWAYEKEYRVINNSKYFPLSNGDKITRIIIGHRMDNNLKTVLDKICKEEKIKMKQTAVGLDYKLNLVEPTFKDAETSSA